MARKLTMKQLRQIVNEESDKVKKDLEDVVSDTEEVEADEYADTLEKKKDHLSDVELNKGLAENKKRTAQVLKYMNSLRNKRIALEQELKSRQLIKLTNENKKLRKALKNKNK